jgi:hypothetical protein
MLPQNKRDFGRDIVSIDTVNSREELQKANIDRSGDRSDDGRPHLS